MNGTIGLAELIVPVVLLVLLLVAPLILTWSVAWSAKSIMREYFKLRGEK